jgi:uncharacterized protein (DUF2225 family)
MLGATSMLDNLFALYDKKCVCRHCTSIFHTKRVRSGSQAILKRDADFCTYYKEQALNPIMYTVHVCPECGFAFTDQFAQTMLPATKKLVQEHITAKWTPKDFGGVRSHTAALACYKLAIYAAELTGEAHSVKAGLYLRVAWLFRFKGNDKEESRFLKLAVREYEQSYIHSDYVTSDKEMSEVRILYLIGELMRRVRQFDKAILYFSKALEFRNRTVETGILAMAHDQWQLAREEYKRQQAKIG